ncbi:peptidase inhibitor family I36 protein [Streptomyces tauricus]|uniref:peptidase inhibitor family I36 protein n=1 Tax=Streptomyces tauricus TaxID=68274 RepID=UPI0022437A23|nr:peptidase inhibitor family I36 protein [Streptomyces tauricus]MCW8103378.1 peptidase inhibitor family I36 protein [Streptomyces tauricus]
MAVKDGLEEAPAEATIPAAPAETSISAAPEEPAAPVGGCDQADNVCLYKNTEYGGPKKFFPVDNCVDDFRAVRTEEVLSTLNDSVSSVVNNSTKNIRLYEGTGRSGRYIEVLAGATVADLHVKELTVLNGDGSVASSPGEFNDVASSLCAV